MIYNEKNDQRSLIGKNGAFSGDGVFPVGRIAAWYEANKRDLPWRRNTNAYYIWVSEIMLQQTRVEAVKPYYARFLSNLPTVADLAACPEDKLIKLWEGLGYYSRVRNMQKAAMLVCGQYGGQIPTDKVELLKLPGIGEYTAGAIASIAGGRPVSAVDGNFLRIITRVTADDRDIMSQKFRREITKLLDDSLAGVPEVIPGDFNQGMMDLGAGVCLPNAQPLCDVCPLADICLAHLDGEERKYPVRKEKKPRRVEKHTVLLVRDGDTVMIRKRPESGLLAGMYEFPWLEGSPSQKEILSAVEEAGLTPLQIREVGPARHIFSHIEWHMEGYEIRIASASAEKKWIAADKNELEERYAVPSAYRKYLEYLFQGQRTKNS